MVLKQSTQEICVSPILSLIAVCYEIEGVIKVGRLNLL
jgi:hypothetical protein